MGGAEGHRADENVNCVSNSSTIVHVFFSLSEIEPSSEGSKDGAGGVVCNYQSICVCLSVCVCISQW